MPRRQPLGGPPPWLRPCSVPSSGNPGGASAPRPTAPTDPPAGTPTMASESTDSSSSASGSEGDPRRRTGGRLRTLVALGLLVTASLGVGALLGEVLVRTFAPQQLTILRPDVWQPVDTLGWMHRPGIDTRINTGERVARIITDSMGLRVGERGRIDGDRTVLLLGDSFMAALQVDHEQSLAGLLEAGLTRRLGLPVAVRNAAVGAWDPPHYVLRARSLIDAEPYDLVLLSIYLGNDVVEDAPSYFPPRAPVHRSPIHVPRSLSASDVVDALVRPIDNWLRERSHLHVLLRNQMKYVRIRLGLSGAFFPPGLTIPERDHPKWHITATLIRDVVALASDRGIPTVVVLIPSDFQVDTTLLERHAKAFGIPLDSVDIEQPQRLLGEELVARGIHVIDALPALRAAHAKGVFGYGRIDTHLSPEGHSILWSLLESPVLEYLIGSRSRAVPPG